MIKEISTELINTLANVGLDNPLSGVNNLGEFFNKLVNFVFYLTVIGIAPLMYVWAGVRFVTAAGDPEKIKMAKGLAFWVTIGLIVVFAAKGLISFITQDVFRISL